MKNEKVPAPAPLMVSGNVGVGRLNLDTAIAQSCGLAFSVAGVKGLFQNFHSAATALRIAWHVGEIHEIESDSDTVKKMMLAITFPIDSHPPPLGLLQCHQRCTFWILSIL
jgi:hypothetical protein